LLIRRRRAGWVSPAAPVINDLRVTSGFQLSGSWKRVTGTSPSPENRIQDVYLRWLKLTTHFLLQMKVTSFHEFSPPDETRRPYIFAPLFSFLLSCSFHQLISKAHLMELNQTLPHVKELRQICKRTSKI